MSAELQRGRLTRLESRWLQLPIDLALVAAAWWFAFWLRFNLDTPDEFQTMMLQTLVWPLLGFAASLLGLGVYRHIWRYTSVAELTRLSYAVALGGLLTAAAILMLRVEFFPRSVLLLHPLLALVALGAARALARIALSGAEPQFLSGKPLLIVGSVQDAAAALPALRGLRQWTPVGIVSPIPAEQGRSLQGLSVVGVLGDLPRLAERLEASAALIVSPPGSDARRAALMGASEVGLPLLTMPRPDEWLRNDHSQPRRVELEDLLGRAPVALDEQGLSELIAGQTVMVTGGARSAAVAWGAWSAWMWRSTRCTRSNANSPRRTRRCKVCTTPAMCASLIACSPSPSSTGPPPCSMPQPTSMCR